MKSMNDGNTLKDWFKVIDKIHPFNSGNLSQTPSKDRAIANAVYEIRETFRNYKIDMSYFYDKFYVYQEGYWNEINEELMEIFLRDCTRNIYKAHMNFHTSNFYKSLKETFRDELRIISHSNDEKVLLNCSNFTLEFYKNEIKSRAHSKKDYMIYKLKYDYNQKATSPMWDSFLNEMLPDVDQQLLLHQFIGYTFTNHIKLEKALYLYGEGGNGKSVVQEVVTKLLGEENTSSVSIGKLTKDENAVMLIEGKLLNYCSENEKTLGLNQFKSLVSGEPVIGKKLYRDVRFVKKYAKLMFNLNSLPKISDEKHSYMRRLLILSFNKKPKVIDPELHFKIINAELSGIFNRVIDALVILLKEKKFVKYKELDEIFKDYNYDNDLIQQYIDEAIEKGFPEGATKVSELHQYYVTFCKNHGEKHEALVTFAKELGKKGYEKLKRKGGSYYDLEVEGGSYFS